MITQHTPGPWFVNEFEPTIVGSGQEDIYQICDTANSMTFDREECEANARLIAAAPELLAALEAILLFIPVSSAKDGGASSKLENVKAADMVRAAIAKAKGTQ